MKTFRFTFQKNGEMRIKYIEASTQKEAKRLFKELGLGKYETFCQWPLPY
ncbi:hypothetical protein [Larkinella harenae]